MFLTRVVSSLFILQISYVDAASEFLLNDFLAVNIAPVTWSDFKLLPSLSFGGYLPDGLFFFWGGVASFFHGMSLVGREVLALQSRLPTPHSPLMSPPPAAPPVNPG